MNTSAVIKKERLCLKKCLKRLNFPSWRSGHYFLSEQAGSCFLRACSRSVTSAWKPWRTERRNRSIFDICEDFARWIRSGSGQFPPPGGALRMRKGQRMNLILNRRAKPDAKAVSIVMADMLAAHSMQKLAARAIKISNPADARY